MEKDAEKTEKAEQEPKKKVAKKEEPVKKRELYKVKMEVMAPVELTFKVWAYSPEEAAQLANISHLADRPKPILARMKKIKARVYGWFFTNVLHTRSY
jgi:hypothetical protein